LVIVAKRTAVAPRAQPVNGAHSEASGDASEFQ
jgi:hypothetical protein